MSKKVTKLEFIGDKELTTSVEDTKITATSSKLSIIESTSEESWKSDEILGFRCDSKVSGGGHPIVMELESGDVELLQISESSSALKFVEKLAKHMSIRFEEYTGRSVEGDEHGMNVIEQIVNFPERWPALQDNNYSLVKFTTIGRFICFTIPSVVQPMLIGVFAITCLVGLVLGLPFSGMIDVGDSALLSLMTLFAPLTAILLLWILPNRKYMHAKHEIRMTSKRITVIPKFLGLFPMSARSWDIDQFRDLDVAEGGRLTFLFGDERLFCDMDILEAEWVFSEIANQLEVLGLADRQYSEE